jgi:hypothetical protein
VRRRTSCAMETVILSIFMLVLHKENGGIQWSRFVMRKGIFIWNQRT